MNNDYATGNMPTRFTSILDDLLEETFSEIFHEMISAEDFFIDFVSFRDSFSFYREFKSFNTKGLISLSERKFREWLSDDRSPELDRFLMQFKRSNANAT